MINNNTILIYPLNDNIGYVRLYEWMGNDETIVNRARTCYQSFDKQTAEKDKALIKQIVGAKIMHGTTLRGVVMSFNVKLPLFVMRQWTRHLVGHNYESWEMGESTFPIASSFDEMSLRYVDARNLQFYNPKTFRKNWDEERDVHWQFAQDNMLVHYEQLRDLRVPKELARSFIPQNVYTEMHWTANLQAVLDWADKREIGSGAQTEHTAYAIAVIQLIEKYVSKEVIDIWRNK